MKIVIALLTLMPMSAHALSYPMYRPLPPCGDYVDDCAPQNPKPFPKPCPRPWDDCGHDPYKPLDDLRAKTSGLSAAIADGKLDKAGESLDGLFTGVGSKTKGSEFSVVAVVGWMVEPRSDSRLSKFMLSPRREVIRPLIERRAFGGEGEFKIVPVDLKEEAAKEIIKAIVKEAVPVVKEAVKRADDAISERLTRPDTERARQEYGGCRMKGTCPK